jgi:hypothetical protein
LDLNVLLFKCKVLFPQYSADVHIPVVQFILPAQQQVSQKTFKVLGGFSDAANVVVIKGLFEYRS